MSKIQFLQIFEEKLRDAIADAQRDISANENISKMTVSVTSERSKRFLDNLHEWTVVYGNPAIMS